MVLRVFAVTRRADRDSSNALHEDLKPHACKFTSSYRVKSKFHTVALLYINVLGL